MTTAPTIDTARLRLRPMRMEDFEAYAALFTSDRSRYMDGPLTRNEAWHGFAADAGQWALLGHGAWSIERLRDDALIGQVAINNPPHFPETEIGWMLYDGHEGQGYAREAAEAVRDWAFATFGLTTLVSYIDPDNAASIRLAERLGAVRDATAATPENDPCLVYRHSAPEVRP